MPPSARDPGLQPCPDYSMEKIVAIFDIIQDEAANNCNQSPVVLMPYENTLRIQHRLARVCPSQLILMILAIRVLTGIDLGSKSPGARLEFPLNMRHTPVHSKISRPDTSPMPCMTGQIRQWRYPKMMLCSVLQLQSAA